MRIICLDIGTKRIGVAASDPFGWIAQPIKVIIRKGGTRDLDEIAKICGELEATLVLIGMPLDEEGNVGAQAQKVKSFAARVENRLRAAGIDAPIEMWDERYSTSIAEERLIGANVSRARRKKVIDKMAAVVILQDYLEAHAESGGADEGTSG